MGLLWSALRSSSKIMLTFLVMLLLTFLLILFWPNAYTGLQDFAEGIDDAIRNPPFDEERNVAIYRLFINSTTILGVIMTLISRAIVDFVAFVGGRMEKGVRAESEVDAAEARAGIRDGGYYES